MRVPPPATPQRSDLRVIRALRERLKAAGSYAALARAIRNAQPPDGKRIQTGKRRDPIDRRKLRRAIEGNPDSLTLADLRVLDRYLEVFGQGLAFHPLFEKPALLLLLAESLEITFLIGSRTDVMRQDFSHWDVLGMAEIQRGVNACGPNVRFDIREVYADMNDPGLLQKFPPWGTLLGETGPSLVCIGSGRTIPAAESMVCAMFGGKPFATVSDLKTEDLPFHFVWSKKPRYLSDSPFHLVSNEIEDIDPEAAALVAKGEASAIKIGDKVVVDQVTAERGGVAYGICVAQRRMNGQVWLVVAGNTGVATYVGARLTSQIAIHLSETKQGSASPVYWSVIRARVDKPTPKRPFYSVRNFPEESVFSGPNVWPSPS